MEKAIKYGAVFAEVSSLIKKSANLDAPQLNDIAKAAFSVAEVTFEVSSHYR